jgi:cytidylate kinase
MNNNLIITIGRQFGSGGREIGRMLSEKLNIKMYDKELLTLAAEDSGYSKEIFESHDEKPTSSFLYSLVTDTYSMGFNPATYTDMPLNQKVFLAQFDTIRRLADQESCIIVGRCADYALEELPNCMNIFIYADMDTRIRRIAKLHDLTDAKARDLINKTDKKRANYYNYYSNKKWGDAATYDLCINSSALGLEKTAELILEYIHVRSEKK